VSVPVDEKVAVLEFSLVKILVIFVTPQVASSVKGNISVCPL